MQCGPPSVRACSTNFQMFWTHTQAEARRFIGMQHRVHCLHHVIGFYLSYRKFYFTRLFYTYIFSKFFEPASMVDCVCARAKTTHVCRFTAQNGWDEMERRRCRAKERKRKSVEDTCSCFDFIFSVLSPNVNSHPHTPHTENTKNPKKYRQRRKKNT